MDSNEFLREGRLFAYKVMAETFLLTKGNKKTKEIFPKKIDFKTAELVAGDIFVLHHYLLEEYKRVGLDLIKLIEATGEEVVPGRLSQFEIKELATRADQFLLMTSVMSEYRKASNN